MAVSHGVKLTEEFVYPIDRALVGYDRNARELVATQTGRRWSASVPDHWTWSDDRLD